MTSKELVKTSWFKILVIFIVIITVETIGLSMLLSIEATQGFILITALHSAIITFIIFLKIKKKIHKGQTLLVIGVVFLTGGLLALIFSVGFIFMGINATEQECIAGGNIWNTGLEKCVNENGVAMNKLFEMGYLAQGLSFGSIIVGFLLVVYGIKKSQRSETSVF